MKNFIEFNMFQTNKKISVNSNYITAFQPNYNDPNQTLIWSINDAGDKPVIIDHTYEEVKKLINDSHFSKKFNETMEDK